MSRLTWRKPTRTWMKPTKPGSWIPPTNLNNPSPGASWTFSEHGQFNPFAAGSWWLPGNRGLLFIWASLIRRVGFFGGVGYVGQYILVVLNGWSWCMCIAIYTTLLLLLIVVVVFLQTLYGVSFVEQIMSLVSGFGQWFGYGTFYSSAIGNTFCGSGNLR